MKATEAQALSLMKGPKQFTIPIYQRSYSWKKKQCEQLFEDILRVSSDDNINGHFIGSIVYFSPSIHTVTDVPQLQVIDGQQRLTTISLLVLSISSFLKRNEIEIDTSHKKLNNYYLLNSEEDGDLEHKLLLTKKDKEIYQKLLNDSLSGEEKKSRLLDNFEFFNKKLSKDNIIDVYRGLQKLFVVDVVLEKDKDNPQLIFESLNSTGLALSQSDLIRNYILMGQSIELQKILYEKYWSPMEEKFGNVYEERFDLFVRDYLTLKTFVIPKMGNVYEDYKKYTDSLLKEKNIEEILKELYKYSDHYLRIVLNKECNTGVNMILQELKELKAEVTHPFLMSVYEDYMSSIITELDFKDILNLVKNYVFRRSICGIPTNSMNKTFAILYKSIKKESYLESIRATFQMMDSYRRFPTDSEFKHEIMIKDLYNYRNRNYLLSKLENFERKETVNISEYTIEHIMPQNSNLSESWQKSLGEDWRSVQEKYLHTLGNLTLTGYNSELSDKSFIEKKNMEGGFDESPLRLNKFLKIVDDWNRENVEKRGSYLADIACKIWKSSFLDQDTFQNYLEKEKQNEEERIYSLESYPYLKNESLDLYLSLKQRIMNIDYSIKEEFKKKYIAYKSETNFLDIIVQKSKLILSLNISSNEIEDPKNYCIDVLGKERWGNGDVEFHIFSKDQIDYAMDLIKQAFEKQNMMIM